MAIFKATLIPAVTVPPSSLNPLLCCDSSRDLAEHNITINHKRVFEVQELFEAQYAVAQNRMNKRNIISFDVWRDVDFSGTLFTDEAAAIVFQLKMPDLIPDLGTLQLNITSGSTSYQLTYQNAALEVFNLAQWNGIALHQRYQFNCGQLTF